MRTYKIEGIIIKRRNIGETDRILTVFSKNYGKIRVKAPGIRKINSRRAPYLELLNNSILTLYSSHRSSLPIVTEANGIHEFSYIKSNLEKIGFAYYVCELADGLCPDNQENRKVFSLLQDTLNRLERSYENSSILLDFENKLLEALGFLPNDFSLKDRKSFIEQILERKIKTKQTLSYFREASATTNVIKSKIKKENEKNAYIKDV